METETSVPSAFYLHELYDTTDEVFFAFYHKTNSLIHVNAAFKAVWKIPPPAIGVDFSAIIKTVHPADRLYVTDAFDAFKTNKQKQNIEFRIVLPDGVEKWIRVKAYLCEKNNNEVIIGIAEDISAFKDYSNTLHKFSDKKNSVLHMMSHDLLGPLGNIEMSISMLTEDTILTVKQTELLGMIAESNKRGVTLIRDLINDEFIQSSEASLVKQRIEIIKRLERILHQYQHSPAIKSQQFIFRSSETTLFVNVDESKFMQAIINLISNAQKFTSDNGKIEVSVEAHEKEVIIQVEDDGIGIPKHLQPYLFDKFTRARRQGLSGEPSIGLGMSIIKTIIEWHQGSITFKSTEGKGTTFTIKIPREA